MASQWFFRRGDQTFGPFGSSDLKQLAAQGQLLPSDFVQKEGHRSWRPASELQGLFATAQPAKEPIWEAEVVAQPVQRPEQKMLFAEWHADFFKFAFDLGPPFSYIIVGLIWFFYGFLWIPIVYLLAAPQGSRRPRWLVGKWQSQRGDGLTFQFTPDGAMVRSDGEAVKYRWLSDEMVELYLDDDDRRARIQILSLSPHEVDCQDWQGARAFQTSPHDHRGTGKDAKGGDSKDNRRNEQGGGKGSGDGRRWCSSRPRVGWAGCLDWCCGGNADVLLPLWLPPTVPVPLVNNVLRSDSA
jgi:hypothetical protein